MDPPRRNRHMRRILNQAAHAAVTVKGSILETIVAWFRALDLHKPSAPLTTGLPFDLDHSAPRSPLRNAGRRSLKAQGEHAPRK